MWVRQCLLEMSSAITSQALLIQYDRISMGMNEETSERRSFVRKGNKVIMPFVRDQSVYCDDALANLYKRIKAEGIWNVVFHDNPEMDLYDFMSLFMRPTTFLQIMSIVEEDKFKDIAGMAWLTDVINCSGKLLRGEGSFLFFKDYQNPKFTNEFGRMILDFWFMVLGLDTVVGLTPITNRPAISYIRRMGFSIVGSIPKYTTLGEATDAVISCMTRDDYLALREADNRQKNFLQPLENSNGG